MRPEPSVSVLVMTYQHAPFIEHSLRAVLALEGSPVEVLVWDDHSTDGTWSRITSMVAAYTGPHRVRTFRHPHNVGGAQNALSMVHAATGKLLIQSHGDDMPYPDRVVRIVDLWRRTGASMITHDVDILEHGAVQGAQLGSRPGRVVGDRPITLEELLTVPFRDELLGATMAFTRDIFDRFAPWDMDQLSAFGPGDSILPFRAALTGGLWFLDAPLTRWRQHGGQVSRFVVQPGATGDKVAQSAGHETLKAFLVVALQQRLRDIQHCIQQAPSPATVQRLAVGEPLKQHVLDGGKPPHRAPKGAPPRHPRTEAAAVRSGTERVQHIGRAELARAHQRTQITLFRTLQAWSGHRATLEDAGRVLAWPLRSVAP